MSACLVIIFLGLFGLLKVFRIYSWQYMFEEYSAFDVGVLVLYFLTLLIGGSRCWACNNYAACDNITRDAGLLALFGVVLLATRVARGWQSLQREKQLGSAARHLDQKIRSWQIDVIVLIVAVLSAIFMW